MQALYVLYVLYALYALSLWLQVPFDDAAFDEFCVEAIPFLSPIH